MDDRKRPEDSKAKKVARGVLQVAGSVPYVGGMFSAVAGAWSEREQEKVNNFFQHWVRMLEDEIKEKEQTIIEILARIDLQDQKISERVGSKEFQSLMKKTFRDWAGAESEKKRVYIRNILSNAAASDYSSDDVVKLFIDWLKNYSEMHFEVIGAIYNSNGISREDIWSKIGRSAVREDSADADLFKLIIRDLSMGGIIRQHRETDYYGNYVKSTPKKRSKSNTLKSAFDDEEEYELTSLGQQFVHYAMNELAPRVDFDKSSNG